MSDMEDLAEGLERAGPRANIASPPEAASTLAVSRAVTSAASVSTRWSPLTQASSIPQATPRTSTRRCSGGSLRRRLLDAGRRGPLDGRDARQDYLGYHGILEVPGIYYVPKVAIIDEGSILTR
jgi:hypothetical protein